jgi:hypothetical protein
MSMAATTQHDPMQKYETWITGDVLTSGGVLLFLTDHPVQGDATRSLVLLGAEKSLAGVLLPMYMKAAEQKMQVRLYGVLMHSDTDYGPGYPKIEFITWKIHMPDEPDELNAKDKIKIKPGDTLPGAQVIDLSKPFRTDRTTTTSKNSARKRK